MTTTATVLGAERSRHDEPVRGAALILSFPGRRYHATPWGHHVNEGLVEWPPSPWRLLRALLSTGYTKLGWPGAGPPLVGRTLIEKLAAVLPSYRLPRAVGTHSRHYMPLARFDKGREQTTLVLDTWAQVDEGTLGVHWNVELTTEESVLFADLARELGYLGRSESWVDGEIREAALEHFDVRSGEFRDRPGPGWEQVPLLAPLPAAEYAAWREREVHLALAKVPKVNAKGKALKPADLRKAEAEVQKMYPVDIIACLQVESGWLQGLGWSQPPGTRKMFYWRPSDSLEGAGPRALPRVTQPAPVEFMLLSMATQSGNKHALPPVVRTLPQGELLHRALLSRASEGREAPPVVLSGRDSRRKPLAGEISHQHAHLLHLDLDGDGHLDHVLLWAPMGMDAEAQAAVRAVRRTFTKGGTGPLRLALAASGTRDELLRVAQPWGGRLRVLLGDTGGATRWASVTPFVPPRYVKSRGPNTLEGQILAEFESRGLKAPSSVKVLDPHDESGRTARHFVKARRFGQAPPVASSFMISLTFEAPIWGPMALGYGCHFGLGLFSATTGELA
jgi:CRISPR-associated protein Csb2